MLRYVLLAGAAAVAIPCAGLAQVQWSQPLTGEPQASTIMNQGGPLNSTTDYDIPFNQAPTGVNASDYATAQAQDATRSGQGYIPDASEDTTTAQAQPTGAGVYGSQPAGGYYYSSQGDQPLATADQTAPDQSGQGYYTGDQGTAESQTYSGQGEGAYSGQPYQTYGGGGWYTNQPGQPPSYVGQGAGSSQSQQMGQGLGGEGAYQQGNAGANQGYASGGYYTGEQGTSPNQPYAPPQGAYGDQGYQGGYYSGQQGAYPSQPSASPPQGTYGDQGYQGGYYTGQQGVYGGQSGYYTGQPTAGQVQSQPGALAYNGPVTTQQRVVVVGAHDLTSRRYARKTTISNVYEIEAARIALQRSQSPSVHDYANQMIQEHRQGLAVILQASAQAGVPQRPMLDRAHRAMLHRLQTVPADAFDDVYMHQQLSAHMRAASLQEGYLRGGDNPPLQQAAAQLQPVVQQHLDLAFEDSGMAARLAEQRNSELALLDQTTGRGQVYRGYSNQGGQYQGGQYQGGRYQGGQYQGGQYQGGYYNNGAYDGGSSAYNSGAAAGYGGPAGGDQSGAYIAPVPTASAYQTPQPGAATGVSAGAPGYTTGGTGGGYQGYTGYQGAGAGQPGYGGATGVTPGGTTPGYQPYTPNAGAGAGTQGTMGTTGYGTGAGVPGTSGYGTGVTPGYGAPGYQGYTGQGMGTTTPGATPGMGTTTPGTVSPGMGPTTPGVTSPGMGTTTPGTTSPGAGATAPTGPHGGGGGGAGA